MSSSRPTWQLALLLACGRRVSESVRSCEHGDRRRSCDNINKSWWQKSRRESGKAKSVRDVESSGTLAPKTRGAGLKKSDCESRNGPFFVNKISDASNRVSNRRDRFAKRTGSVTKRKGNAGKGKCKSFSDVWPKWRTTAPHPLTLGLL